MAAFNPDRFTGEIYGNVYCIELNRVKDMWFISRWPVGDNDSNAWHLYGDGWEKKYRRSKQVKADLDYYDTFEEAREVVFNLATTTEEFKEDLRSNYSTLQCSGRALRPTTQLPNIKNIT